MMDLSTTYLGMPLPHPMIVGAGPLSDELGRARALEDAGAALIVLRSLYEEEIVGEQMDTFFASESYSDSFAEAGSFAPEPELALGPDEYLEHLRKIKGAVRIPVMASLNACTPGGWLSYARQIEEAGADGLELHLFHAASDMTTSAADVERQFTDIVREVKRSVRFPIAVKLPPRFTAFAQFARQLDAAGADGLVLFSRYQRVDVDVEALEVIRSMPLSDSSELSPRLRGAAALSGRIEASIGITGGVHTGLDVIKATMAGAHATQLVSALLRHGPNHLQRLRRDIEAWMHEHEWNSLSEMRGNMSLEKIPDPAAYERANFRMALR
jgi:dihydroorotate dehydrogenase (fumarate)